MDSEKPFTEGEMRLSATAFTLQEAFEELLPEGVKAVFVFSMNGEFSIGRAHVDFDEAHHLLRQAIESLGEDLPTNPLRLVVDNTTGASNTSIDTTGDGQ